MSNTNTTPNTNNNTKAVEGTVDDDELEKFVDGKGRGAKAKKTSRVYGWIAWAITVTGATLALGAASAIVFFLMGHDKMTTNLVVKDHQPGWLKAVFVSDYRSVENVSESPVTFYVDGAEMTVEPGETTYLAYGQEMGTYVPFWGTLPVYGERTEDLVAEGEVE
jgi:hypothetical protein